MDLYRSYIISWMCSHTNWSGPRPSLDSPSLYRIRVIVTGNAGRYTLYRLISWEMDDPPPPRLMVGLKNDNKTRWRPWTTRPSFITIGRLYSFIPFSPFTDLSRTCKRAYSLKFISVLNSASTFSSFVLVAIVQALLIAASETGFFFLFFYIENQWAIVGLQGSTTDVDFTFLSLFPSLIRSLENRKWH